jgi:acetyl esterase/lipase
VHLSRYGRDADQFGELRMPAPDAAPPAVAVLVHGGYWRSRWQLDLMDALAIDLQRRGFASWNIEYRRPDRHGWDATAADVDAAVRHLDTLAGRFPVDLARLVLIGHSAGGQLAARAAADLVVSSAGPRPAVLVSLAGVLDLAEAHRRHLGDGAVAAALGGSPADRPDVYRAASPSARVPLGIGQVIVTVRGDDPGLNEVSDRYVAAARAAGDRVTVIEGDGDHFTLIDPASRVWADTMDRVRDILAAGPPGGSVTGAAGG